MLNNTSSLPKLSCQLARGDESSITAKSVDKPAESFGSVLARQMSGHTAADKAAGDAKSADSGTTTATDEKDPQAAPATLADQAANPLAILLLTKQESKSAPDTGGRTVVADELSAAAAADPDNRKPVGSELKDEVTGVSELKDKTTAAVPGGMLTVSPELAGRTTTEIDSSTIAASLVHKAAAEPGDKSTSSVNKPAIGTPALSANSTDIPARAPRSGTARDKPDAAVSSSVTSADVAAKPVLHSEPLKATELTSALSGAMQSPHAQTGTTPGFLQPGATPASGNTFTAPLGHSAWPAEFSQKVSWISTQKNQVAELHLNPPELGPINIVLKISDNQATAQFTSPHSAVRDAIENAMPKLRESLADNGIMLGQATVSDQTPRDNSAHHMNQRAHSRRMADDAPADAAMASLPPMTARQHKGMVDTFA